jgi:dolichyl-phosphate beta-glucosyltransferase
MRRTQPAYRRAAGSLFTFVRRRLAVPDIEDTQCPLKGFRREAARRLFGAQRLSGWAFDVEILFLARRFGLRVVEVPVQWRHVGGSRLRTNPLTGLRVLWDLLRMRWLHRRLGSGS